ncbi:MULTISPECIES: SDR family oxidoreductase [unclassified Microbacterium]|uniref:SDR family oxidoreductase n=1 Tax=unclassified Microbacterium TaxID=2609290 RepID=UPI00214AC161|nr:MULTISPECIES: SDR family oxidoreductase [unclassified Microbacterium]MCR2784563.1 SDR family oxidoreductase [Microbacterium sp. zg.B96]WIM17600.1 SDR family oxidoreductase [Microbacterium sp. zg-B96]
MTSPGKTPSHPLDLDSSVPQRSALVVGATGIGGSALVDLLVEQGWPVTALSRRPLADRPGVRALSADLRSAAALADALAEEKPTHVFFTAWSRQDTEEQNIAVNGGMVRDLFAALSHAPVQHAALVTGLKHYLGPFEAYGQGNMPDTPFHEEEARLDAPNFYYAQEDELFAAAERDAFTWSVHRSHTVIGYAVGNAMNMGLTLAVYASICRHLGTPFVFPGSLTQWNGLTDMTDATVLADQMLWASTSDAGRDEAFNVVNGDVFRWRWMWTRLAEYFGVEPVGPDAEPQPLERQMAAAQDVWTRIAREHDLAESDLGRIASWWHTDADLGREIEVVTDISKSRLAGFGVHHRTVDSFTELFDRYRAARLIPGA